METQDFIGFVVQATGSAFGHAIDSTGLSKKASVATISSEISKEIYGGRPFEKVTSKTEVLYPYYYYFRNWSSLNEARGLIEPQSSQTVRLCPFR